MNYQKIYDQIIDRARNCAVHGYSERHHIIPKCLGGSNSQDNIVELRADEHYLCHQLLVKIHPDNRKLIHAAHMMTVTAPDQSGRSNKKYMWLKKRFSESQTGEKNHMFGRKLTDEQRKKCSQPGKLNPMYGVHLYGRINTPETRAKISKANKGVPHGPMPEEGKLKRSLASKGRIKEKKLCPHCDRLIDPGNYKKYHGDNCKGKA